MDKQLHTPEEEAYLRMLDREVPDLWGRIEAGLDRAEHEAAENREARFLAGREEGRVVSIEQARAKRKGNRTGLIIGIVAAAVVLIASLAVFGLSGREKKSDSASKSDTLNVDMQGLQANEAVDNRKEESDGMGAEATADDPDAYQGGSAPEMNNAALDKDKKEKGASWNYGQNAEAVAEEDSMEESEARAAAKSQPSEIVTVVSEVKTLGQLMDYEKNMSVEDRAKVEDGKFRITYEENGVAQKYVLFGKDTDGSILLLEEGIYLSEGMDDDKVSRTIHVSPDRKIGMRMVDGRMEFAVKED